MSSALTPNHSFAPPDPASKNTPPPQWQCLVSGDDAILVDSKGKGPSSGGEPLTLYRDPSTVVRLDPPGTYT